MLKRFFRSVSPDIKNTKIVCAANKNKKTGRIVCGVRHWDKIMRSNINPIDTNWMDWEQGFVDNTGKWLSRKEALRIVKENGQSFDKKRNKVDYQLFSEGLY